MQGTDMLTGSNQGFRVLLRDISVLTQGEPGIELGTLRKPSMFKDGFSTPEPLPPVLVEHRRISTQQQRDVEMEIGVYCTVIGPRDLLL